MDEYIKREDALDAVLFAMAGTGYQSRAISAIRDVPTADVAPETGWISLDERLPKKMGVYLVYSSDEGLCLGAFLRCLAGGTPAFKKSVTHWMPLPEPPKGD